MSTHTKACHTACNAAAVNVPAITFIILIACLAVGGTHSVAADDPWYQALSEADKRIQTFERAVDAGDTIAMQRAALELQADPIAVKRFNQSSTDAYRASHNRVTDGIKAKTRQRLRETIARERGVRPDQVTTFEATNPPKPGDPIKVGQDWDVTVRVDGVDVHHTVSGQHVNDAFYEAVNGTKPPSAKAANALAHRQAIEVTSYQHPEAYGGAQSEGGKIISDPAGSPTLRDPEQLGNTIDFKSRLPGNEAAKLEAAGRFVEAQGFRMEQARQAAKQFDRQVAVRVAAMGGEVPAHVDKAMDILRDIGDGKLTPSQGQRLLAAMGESIDSVASKSAGLIESAQTLRPGGLGASDDVFVTNAKNRLRSKGIDPDNLKPLSPGADLSDLRKSGGTAARSWASLGMQTLEVVGWAADFYELSQAARDYLSMLNKALDPNISDEEAQRYFDKMKEAAHRVTLLGGMGALFEAYPPAAGVFGVYTITRLGLENTQTGKAIDNVGFVIADTGMQIAEKAKCSFDEFFGIENICAEMDDQNRDKLLTYLRAIREGKLVLVEPYDARDLGKSIMLGVSTDDMVVRVDEYERLKNANQQHDALLAQLAGLRSQCAPLIEKRFHTIDYYDETMALVSQLSGNPLFRAANDAAVESGISQCDYAKSTSTEVAELAKTVIKRSTTAQQAYSGALERLAACRFDSDIDEALQLTDMGRAVAVGAASQAAQARIGYARLSDQLSYQAPAKAALDEYTSAQLDLDVGLATLKNRVDVVRSMRAEVKALESACNSGIRAARAEVSRIAALLPASANSLGSELDSITADSADSTTFSKTEQEALFSNLDREAARLKLYVSSAAAQLAQCASVDSREADLLATNTAIRSLPDTAQWAAEVAALSSQCRTKLDNDSEKQETSRAENDDRESGWEGYDEDEGNLDADRVAENGVDTEAAAENWPPAGEENGRGQNTAGEGDLMDPGYREDPLARAEREREQAEVAERIAARDSSRRRGRDGDADIADEFGEAPDTDDLPDPNRPRPGKDERQPRDMPQTSVPADNPTPPQPGPVPQPEPEPAPDPEPQPQEEPQPQAEPEPQPQPQPQPQAEPEPAPVRPPTAQPEPEAPSPNTTDARCRAIVSGLESSVPRMTSNMSRFQQAASAKDEELAQRLGCQIIADSDKTLATFQDLDAANCPMQGDVRGLRNNIHNIRSQINRSLNQQCGVQPTVGRYEGKWMSPGTCPQSGNAGHRWVIELTHRNDRVSGRIYFHKCPGGGRATYAVSGDANGGDVVSLNGSLVDSRGPLAEQVSRNVTFSISRNAPPSPNFAP